MTLIEKWVVEKLWEIGKTYRRPMTLIEKWVLEKLWEIGIRGKMWRMVKMTGCAKRAAMYKARRGNIEIVWYFTRSCTRMYVITHFVQGIY